MPHFVFKMIIRMLLVSPVLALVLEGHAAGIKVLNSSYTQVVVRESLYSDPNTFILQGWTATTLGDWKIDWKKIESGDEDYLKFFSDKIDSQEIYLSTVLLEKANADLIANLDLKITCAFTGVDGYNFNCNHYSDSLDFNSKTGTLIFIAHGKWSVMNAFAFIMEKNSQGSYEATAYSKDLADILEDKMIQVLDQKHSRSSIYREQRDLLVPWIDSLALEKNSHGLKIDFNFIALIPKVEELYTGSAKVFLQSPTGKGHLRPRLK